MLGELLFQKLRTVQRLERVIDEIKIKRSPDDSALPEHPRSSILEAQFLEAQFLSW